MTQVPLHQPQHDALRLLAASRADSGGHAAGSSCAEYGMVAELVNLQVTAGASQWAAGSWQIIALVRLQECPAAALHAVHALVAATSALPALLHASSVTDLQQPDTAVLQTLDPLLDQQEPCAQLLCLSPARVCLAAGACCWRNLAWLQPKRTQQQRSSVLPSAQICSVWCEAAFCYFS